jgi:adenosine deaminase
MLPVPSDLASLPKAELHIHLEGTVRPATLEEFAARTGVSIPRTFNSLNTFVEMYLLAWRTMTQPGDYARLVREYCADAARSGIRYAELQMAMIGRPYDQLAEAVEEAQRQRDVVVKFIIDVPRALPVEVGWAMLEKVQGIDDVVAIGLGGPEDGYPAGLFTELFAEAKRRGYMSAPHSGEDAGADAVQHTIDTLAPERILHGVRSVENPAVVQALIDSNVALSLCPTSNLLLGVCRTIEDHPLRDLWDAGVTFSVNTDDPGFFDCDLTGEYAIAGRLLGLDRQGYAKLARASVDTSFAPDSLKADLRRDIDDWASR